jgi:hypothetical protein
MPLRAAERLPVLDLLAARRFMRIELADRRMRTVLDGPTHGWTPAKRFQHRGKEPLEGRRFPSRIRGFPAGTIGRPASTRFRSPMKSLWLALSLLPLVAAAAGPKEKFLSNGELKIGVDLDSGGSIFWFSELPADRNLLNHHDRGRFIQQSYYGKPDGSKWVDKPWRWNPVQGGDYRGKPARVLETRQDKNGLYVKSVPVHWAGGEELGDCVMEEWISLRGKVAEIRFRFTYAGGDAHPPAHQELPAVFVDHALEDLVFYQGARPWTGAPLSREKPGWPNEARQADEEWAGYLGPDGRGLGVHFPGTTRLTSYRYPGPAGPQGAGCSYFAPVRTMRIVPGFVHDYTLHLTIGSAPEMRERFGALRTAAPPNPPP